MAFSKRFLVQEKGANPVYYVATDSVVHGARGFLTDAFAARIEEAKRNSRFDRGLQFDNMCSFLVDAAAYLSYLAGNSSLKLDPSRNIDAQQLDKSIMRLLSINEAQLDLLKELFNNNTVFFEHVSNITYFLFVHFIGFTKAFDSSLPEDDPGNFYLEREWRVDDHMQFSLGDIQRIILPRSYGERFRRDVPEYFGEVCFPEST